MTRTLSLVKKTNDITFQSRKILQFRLGDQRCTHLRQPLHGLTAIIQAEDRVPARAEIAHTAIPGTTLFQPRLSHKGLFPKAMDYPVPAQGPLGGERLVVAIFRQIEQPFSLPMPVQFKSNHRDHAAAGFQAGLLRFVIRTHRVSGYQGIALQCRLSADFPGKHQVFPV